MKNITVAVLSLLLIASCNSPDNPRKQFLQKHKTGVVIPKVLCKNSMEQNYCLYLPTSYDAVKEMPVIYAFDPHGIGRIPVELMKDRAEKLGYILIGSNNSKNGLRGDEINSIVNTLLNDTREKLAINNKRVYLAGFSGGARVACGLAQSNKGINSVIACSAGFRPGKERPPFHFIGIAGLQDMNYLEMKLLHNLLLNFNAEPVLLTYEGKHEWPPKSVMEEAMTILEFYAMKDSITPVDNEIITGFATHQAENSNKLMSGANPDSLAKAYFLSTQTIEILKGYTDTKELESISERLTRYPEIRNYFIKQATFEEYEQQKQQELASSFESKPKQWWMNELKSISADTLNRDKLEKDAAIRLLGFVSLSCYSYVNMALQTQDWKALDLYTAIYKKCDPKNYYCYYALACLNANTGKISDALEDLKKSVEYGNRDTGHLREDPFLKNLVGLPEFEDIASK
jgi:hypothetical protein